MDEVRYGIVGTGMMGCEHIWNIALVDGARVTAICDPVESSREWALASLEDDDVVEVFTDHRRLLDEAPVDAVVIATPNHTHRSVLEDVWGRRVHVLVEKPLCATVEDGLAVRDAATAHPGVVQVGLEYRYMPPVARALDEVRGGACGRIAMVAIREHRFPFLGKVGDWNRFARNTGGTLVEKCCHFFDLMRLVAGSRPERVYASAGQDVNHLDESYDGEVPDIRDNAFAIVDFTDGTRASLDLCMFAEASRDGHRVTVTGDRGQVECLLPAGRVIIGSRATGEVREDVVEIAEEVARAGFHHGATYYEHLAFLRAVREGATPEVTADDGLWSVGMGVAAERSASEGRPVTLDEVGVL